MKHGRNLTQRMLDDGGCASELYQATYHEQANRVGGKEDIKVALKWWHPWIFSKPRGQVCSTCEAK